VPKIHGDPRDARFLLALGQIGTHIQTHKPSYIYALWDPDTLQIRYIGRSANVKDRLQKHIDSARSDKYRSSTSEWIQSLLERDERPAAHILETIYPCWALLAREWTHWYLHGTLDGQSRQAGFAYDIYVSEREIRHILHAAAQGYPLLKMVGNGQGITLEGLDTTGVDFLTIEHEHPIWGMIRSNMRAASPPSAPTVEENIENLMQNARNARAR
jgi:hypothetical protein